MWPATNVGLSESNGSILYQFTVSALGQMMSFEHLPLVSDASGLDRVREDVMEVHPIEGRTSRDPPSSADPPP